MPAPLTPADRLEMADLAARYATAVDNRTFEQLREVFTPDCVLDTGRSTREGVDAVIDAMHGLLRYEATAHLVGQQVVDTDDGTVRGLTYCTAHHLLVDGENRTDTVMHIRYHDIFLRAQGPWRISHRRLEVAWTDQQAVH